MAQCSIFQQINMKLLNITKKNKTHALYTQPISSDDIKEINVTGHWTIHSVLAAKQNQYIRINVNQQGRQKPNN